jgi:hypothetical protein
MRPAFLSRARSAVVAVLVGLLPAACATTRYTQSGIVALPPDVKGRPGSTASLEIEGLKLRIETLDRAPQSQAIPRLALRLVFEPKEIGYAFDPEQVVLRGGDGATWRPHAAGPGTFDGRLWSCATGAAPGVSEPGYHFLASRSCFDLDFEVTVAKDTRLALVVGGLARGQRRIEPLTLTVARRSGRTIDRVYWLEILLAPFAYGMGSWGMQAAGRPGRGRRHATVACLWTHSPASYSRSPMRSPARGRPGERTGLVSPALLSRRAESSGYREQAGGSRTCGTKNERSGLAARYRLPRRASIAR